MAEAMSCVRQNAPTMPGFSVGSPCFVTSRRTTASARDDTGHSDVSFQSR